MSEDSVSVTEAIERAVAPLVIPGDTETADALESYLNTVSV